MKDTATNVTPLRAAATRGDGSPSDAGPHRRRTEATRIVELLDKSGIELFRDPARNTYATVSGGATLAVNSPAFSDHIRYVVFKSDGSTPSEATLRDVAALCHVRALYDGAVLPVFIRVGRMDDRLFLDLADSGNRVVEVSSAGWRIQQAETAPIRFRRSPAMLPLPCPSIGGRLDALRPLLNIRDDELWSLVAGWLVTSLLLVPHGPYPVLVLHGQQGAAKTSCSRMCAAVFDPKAAALRAVGSELEQVAIAADNGYVIIFDNVSSISKTFSDALCRISTGSGFGKRKLWTGRDEETFDAARPVIINGIGHAITAPDLLDRSVIVELDPIPPSERKTDSQLRDEYSKALPGVLGGLLDAASLALRRDVSGEHATRSLPRMAEFFVHATAAEPAMGVAPGTFARAYRRSVESAAEVALASQPVGLALIEFMRTRETWSGSAAELLQVLVRPSSVRFNWPETPVKLANDLERISPVLSSAGLRLTQLPRTAKKRLWRLERIEPDHRPAAGDDGCDDDDGPPGESA